MTTRIAVVAGGLVLAAIALWHPVPRQPQQTDATASHPPRDRSDRQSPRTFEERPDAVVYVAGAVKRPGLYHAGPRDRAADAVSKAGGLMPGADAAGVNLAEHIADGDEVYVPIAGERVARSTSSHGYRPHRRSRSRGRRGSLAVTLLPAKSVDLNTAAQDELAAVPGIGTAIAARIVEMRALDGAFGSIDELLDVAGMTQTRLERARPYLRV